MRYVFAISSRACRGRQRSVIRSLRRRFPAQRNFFLLDPPEYLIDLICRTYGSDGLRLIAVGGDGTVHRLLGAAVRHDVPVGIFPCGTANDLARAIGLKRGMEECGHVIRADCMRAIDLITVNGKPFATCGGLGLPSSVAMQRHRLHGGKSRACVRGFRLAAFLLAALRVLGWSRPVNVRVPDLGPQWRSRAMAVVVSNQACFGALFSVSPAAVNDDGIFDFCIIADPEDGLQKMGIVLQAAFRRKKIGRRFLHTRLSCARILTDRTLPFFGDGEILSCGRDFRIEVLPRAVRLIVPEGVSAEEIRPSLPDPAMVYSGCRHLEASCCGPTGDTGPQSKKDALAEAAVHGAASNTGQNVFT